MSQFDPKVWFAQAPVARLATVGSDGAPHLVPVVFAVDSESSPETVYTGVDAKPKTTQRLRRLANIECNPAISLLVDHYDDDWNQLWWVRIDGAAVVLRHSDALHTGRRLLRAKYPQYQSVSLAGPVIEIAVRRWSSWHA
ncbi:TIGR03668 family PPOX class F420-dependent oxidoreductase [Mycobacterium vicinigordonae]|uniref:TIGR03668 family PPOX class F420-dependent oxidoreductase n=1 Tax=Mycobacterium vicinigordonae TaxID=1719132 RepID=A0A7D6E315_9MYCO|nr:TIGR03668 family PPOX class F420-dependent oxidoreductase [Mycobacterium vicinigordonae]QLL07746.1 TIGR03668 family PPOX class F420-dependent oxidoreductase [Mycobacterium vicinigordonae]